jgi:hypothetical protein
MSLTVNDFIIYYKLNYESLFSKADNKDMATPNIKMVTEAIYSVGPQLYHHTSSCCGMKNSWATDYKVEIQPKLLGAGTHYQYCFQKHGPN